MNGDTQPPELSDDQLEFLNSLFDKARAGQTAALTSVIDQGIPVNLANHKGDTLLILATYHQHTDLVRALLDRGADTSPLNERGQSALTCAVFTQHTENVTTLLEAGADPDLGAQSARATVKAFELPEMAKLLDAH